MLCYVMLCYDKKVKNAPLFNYIVFEANTVKPALSGHSKIDKTKA